MSHSSRVANKRNNVKCNIWFTKYLDFYFEFAFYSVPFLTKRFTIAIPIIASVLLVIVLANMLRTTCSDPGILPRASKGETEYLERSYGNSATASRPPPRTKDIIVKGQTVKSKYCFTCKMFRPPRASHCSTCDNCVGKWFHICIYHPANHYTTFNN